MAIYESQREYAKLLTDHLPDTDNFLFVTEWINIDGEYFAVGEDAATKRHAKFKAPVQSCLYVWAQSIDDLCLLCNVKYLDLNWDIVDLGGSFETNGASALDHILGTRLVNAPWRMFKIPTHSFADSKNLYNMLNSSDYSGIAGYVKTTGTWTLETFIMLQLFELHKDWNKCIVYSAYMNRKMDVNLCTDMPRFDVVSFDIETVSHEPHRIPLGENKTDIIFSASVTRIVHSTGERIHDTLLNLPTDSTFNGLAYSMIRQEGPYGFDLNRRVSIVNSEEELLCKLCAIFDSMPSLYVLLGYNSKNYDMMFVAKRLVFLNMPQMNSIHCQNGILTYGLSMTHVDMYLVISKYFMNELPSFTLKTVVKQVLKGADKVDLDARLLRFIYKHIKDTGLGNGYFKEWDVTLSKLAFYNDFDSILVFKLWNDLQYNDFLLNVSKIYRISLSRVSQSTISEYLSNKIVIDSFKRNVLFTQHHSVNTVVHESLLTRFDNEILASSDETASYGGGFNYRDSKNVYRNVEMMDMVAYYPEMMAGLNLSHETVAIYKVGAFKIVASASGDGNLFDRISVNRFCTHKSCASPGVVDGDLENNVDSRKYISGSLDNASKITLFDLQKLRDDDRISISIQDKRGLLSTIMDTRNDIRNVAKDTKRLLQQAINGVSELILKHELGELDDFFDPEAEDEQAFVFTAEKYLVRYDKTSNADEELILVKSSVRLLSTQELVTFSLDDLLNYREMLKNEFSRINSQYRNLKIVNSSIYGLLGSKYGILRGKHVAAIATMFGRKYIIETGKSGRQNGYRLILSDTDSVFLAPERVDNSNAVKRVIEKLGSINACLKLNNKTYSNVFIIAKKTYFAMSDDPFSRGINKNGPSLWSEIMYNLYVDYIVRRADVTMSVVLQILTDLYVSTYERLKRDKSLVLCRMNVKEVTEYKTQTPAKKLMQRITETTPNYVFGKSISYFHLLQNNPRTVSFALDYELESTPLSQINIYKFYSKIHMAIYHLLSMALIETNKKRGVYFTLNLSDFNKFNLAAFVRARKDV